MPRPERESQGTSESFEFSRNEILLSDVVASLESGSAPSFRHKRVDPATFGKIFPPKGCPSPRHRIRIAFGALKRIEFEPKPKLPLGYGDATALDEMRAWEVASPA